MINRREFIGLGAASALAMAGCSNDGVPLDAGETEFRFGAEMAYAPYNYSVNYKNNSTVEIENVKGQYAKGYDIYFAKKIADALGKKPVAVKLSWDGLIPALQQGQIDAIIAGMSETPERAESVSFSTPYIEDSIGLMIVLGSEYRNCHTLDEFAGSRVAGQKGTLYEEALSEIPKANIAPAPQDMAGVFELLRSGAVDAVTYPKMSEKVYLDIHPEFQPVEFEEGEGFTITNPASVAVRQGDDKLLAIINKVVNETGDTEREELWNSACTDAPA